MAGLWFVLVVNVAIATCDTINVRNEGNETELIETTNWIWDWEAPSAITENFRYYVSGYDYNNRAIVVAEIGKWNTLPAIQRGGKELEDLSKYIMQFVERIGNGYFSRKDEGDTSDEFTDEVVVILDYDGLTIDRVLSPANSKFNAENLGRLESYYDKIAFGFIVNGHVKACDMGTVTNHTGFDNLFLVSAVAQVVINILTPRLGRVFQRMEIYGTEPRVWTPHLLRSLPRDQLAYKYGGVKEVTPAEPIH